MGNRSSPPDPLPKGRRDGPFPSSAKEDPRFHPRPGARYIDGRQPARASSGFDIARFAVCPRHDQGDRNTSEGASRSPGVAPRSWNRQGSRRAYGLHWMPTLAGRPPDGCSPPTPLMYQSQEVRGGHRDEPYAARPMVVAAVPRRTNEPARGGFVDPVKALEEGPRFGPAARTGAADKQGRIGIWHWESGDAAEGRMLPLAAAEGDGEPGHLHPAGFHVALDRDLRLCRAIGILSASRLTLPHDQGQAPAREFGPSPCARGRRRRAGRSPSQNIRVENPRPSVGGFGGKVPGLSGLRSPRRGPRRS